MATTIDSENTTAADEKAQAGQEAEKLRVGRKRPTPAKPARKAPKAAKTKKAAKPRA